MQKLARAIVFDNRSDAPSTTTRTITFTATDKNGLSTTADMALTVTAVNDAPILIDVPATAQAVTAGTAAALDDFTLADEDSSSLTVTLTATNGAIGGLTDADEAATGIQLTGTASAINTALAGATFTATNAGAASIAISVSDGVVATTGTYNLTATAPTDTTPPNATNFTATATTVGATSDENGTLGLYDIQGVLLAKTGGGTLSTAMTAGTAATLTVEAQNSITYATLKVSDTAGTFAAATHSVVLGTSGNNNPLNGTASADFMYGFDGADYLRGGDGADVISGGAGNDLLVGQTGADTLLGGEGNDFLDALWDGANETVTDVLVGGPGDDSLMLNGVDDLFVEKSGEGTLDSLFLGVADIRTISVNGVVGGPLNGADSTGFEQITLTNGIQARLVGAQLHGLVLNVNHVNGQTGGTLTVDATINDTTDLSGLTFNAGTYTNSERNPQTGSLFTGTITILGQSGSETIIGTSRSDTITGAAGADQITTGLGADELHLAASGDSAEATIGGTTVGTITEAAGDVVTGDISDTFVLAGGTGTYNSFGGALAVSSFGSTYGIANLAKVGLDVFVYQDGTKFYLAYETTDGGENDLGTLETVELVGIVDANDEFSVSATGVVSFTAVPNI